MPSIKKIGIRGLRSFGYEEQLIPFSRINIYVGKNSCGKSSFLRTYPLLRQSTESDKTSPVLWYAGHQGYVDFGDFTTALHDGGQTIHFDFELEIGGGERANRIRKGNFTHGMISRAVGSDSIFNIKLTLSITKKNGSIKSTVTIVEGENVATLSFSGNEFEEIKIHNSKWDYNVELSAPMRLEKGCLIPKDAYKLREVNYKDLGKVYFQIDAPGTQAGEKLAEYLALYHHKSKKIENIIEGIEHIPLCDKDRVYRYLRGAFNSDKYFKRKLEENREKILDIVYTHLFIKNIGFFLSSSDSLFGSFYGGVRYLGPLRASAERFYRFQELQIQEIDHTGSNLPMVINSLNKAKKTRLSKWIKESFGFELELQSTGLHYELRIKEDGDSQFHNVSDMGFGYSQILPVIVSLWLELSQSEENTIGDAGIRKRKPRTIVIEQPELHLHPALQHKFGLAIAKVIKLAEGLDYNFVIETHSKHLIDAIGESICEKIIDKGEVNIALFEKNSKGITKVSLAGFDSDGYLENWPAGFLSA